MRHADNRSVLIDAFLMRHTFYLYYWWTTMLNYVMPPVRWGGLTISVLPDIYRPVLFEHRLAAGCKRGERVLDLGCGSGIISVAAARLGATVTAADINPNALLNTIQNCKLNAVGNVTTVLSDLFDNIDGQFDRIITHPPYVELAMEGENHQWATGMGFVERFFAKAVDHLSPAGTAVLMFPHSQRVRLEKLANGSGLRLLRSDPVGWMGMGNFIQRLLYCAVGFAPVTFTFGRAGSRQPSTDRSRSRREEDSQTQLPCITTLPLRPHFIAHNVLYVR